MCCLTRSGVVELGRVESEAEGGYTHGLDRHSEQVKWELMLTLDAGTEGLGVAKAKDTGVVDLGLDECGIVLPVSARVHSFV